MIHVLQNLHDFNFLFDRKSVALRDYSKITEDHYCDKEIQYYEMNRFKRFRDIAIGLDGEIALLVSTVGEDVSDQSTVTDQSTDVSGNSKVIIVILDRNLNQIGVIVDEKEKNNFGNPEGVAISNSKIIAVSDENQVKKYSITGKFISNLEGNEGCQFMGLAFNSDDTLYVADWQNYKIRVAHSADDKFSFSFGSETVGHFHQPTKIAVNPKNNNVFVCDDIGDGIYVFDKAGNFLNKINCDKLTDITVDPTGYLITGHHGNRNTIRFWSPSYQCISCKHFKQKDKEFESISNLAITLTGTLYVIESWKDEKDILKQILQD